MAFDEVSSPVLAKKFSSPDFSPEEYVKALVAKYDLYRALLEHSNDIQKLGEETAVSLKKNVYRNYRQFIDTSKEISYLEAEMYQLSHLLTEQKSLLAEQLETSIFERVKGLPVPKDPAKDASRAKKKNFLNNIDASKQMLAELATKDLLLDGELIEFDPETYLPVQNIGAFLLNDNLLITSLPGDRPSAPKYTFLTMLNLSDLAVVNVRDGQGIKNAFKILFGLDSRMFSTPTKEAKMIWLDQVEKAIKNYKAGVPVNAQKLSEYPSNQDDEDEVVEEPTPEPVAERKSLVEFPNLLNVVWLNELPEDLDMSIAQRDFDGAVKLFEKGMAYLRDFPDSQALTDIRGKIEDRVQNLTAILEKSLDNSHSTRHVSLRSIRTQVLLLIRLGRAKLACELFLRNRSFEIKISFKQLKMEGVAQLYVSKLSTAFFTAMIETGKAYKKIFPNNANCSAFVVWCHKELQHFADKFCRHVFARSSDLAAIAVCISHATEICKCLDAIGMDLTFDFHLMLLKHTMDAMFDTRDQFLERMKHRSVEESLYPMIFEPGSESLTNLRKDLSSLGLVVDFFVAGNQLNLSDSLVGFSKFVLVFLKNSMNLYSSELHSTIMQCLCDVFKAQALQFEALLKADEYISKLDFVFANIQFVSTHVLPVVRQQFESKVGHEVAAMQDIEDQYKKLRLLWEVRQKQRSEC